MAVSSLPPRMSSSITAVHGSDGERTVHEVRRRVSSTNSSVTAWRKWRKTTNFCLMVRLRESGNVSLLRNSYPVLIQHRSSRELAVASKTSSICFCPQSLSKNVTKFRSLRHHRAPILVRMSLQNLDSGTTRRAEQNDVTITVRSLSWLIAISLEYLRQFWFCSWQQWSKRVQDP